MVIIKQNHCFTLQNFNRRRYKSQSQKCKQAFPLLTNRYLRSSISHHTIADENSFHLYNCKYMRLTAKKIAGLLKQRGYKLTPQRRSVLAAIASSSDHLTPAEIHNKVNGDHINVGLVTIYRTLDLLADLGLICEVHSGGNCRSYLLRRPSEHHHHLICSGCGTVVDFTNCDLSDLELRISKDTGFDIKGHLLEFSGYCQQCQTTTA